MSAWMPALTVMAVAALPVFELRGAIPLALFQFGFDPWTAYALSVAGNLLPVPFLLLGLNHLMAWAHHLPWLERPLSWWTARTQHKHSKTYERFGAVTLVLFVAVPLPITGAWTGSLAAVLFGVPFRTAFPLIALGVMISGLIVTLASLGILTLGGWG